MPQCAFKNCLNNHRNTNILQGISFFRFPSDPFRCAEWVSIVAKERGEEIFKPFKNSTICSIHFNSFDITGNIQRRRLHKTAVPKLQIQEEIKCNAMQSTKLSELTNNLSNQVTSLKTIEDTPRKRHIPQTDVVCDKPPDVSLSDLSICDTPKVVYLKNKLRTCRRVIDNKSKKIHNLQKVNKRLTKKILSLKNTINLLQKKQSLDESIFFDLSKKVGVAEVINRMFFKN